MGVAHSEAARYGITFAVHLGLILLWMAGCYILSKMRKNDGTSTSTTAVVADNKVSSHDRREVVDYGNERNEGMDANTHHNGGMSREGSGAPRYDFSGEYNRPVSENVYYNDDKV
uniref:Uncharacterized protein n=1 Tax=Trypanosoma congolense (strain IL3000) TaxID=1068625 RepID=G0UUG2_TRYCI|nr:conserved hypothetical protein [Trypanosoma congolense IL3000]